MSEKRSSAAPGKLTPERQKIICEHLGRGNSVVAATAMAGIDVSSFYLWAKRGRRELDRLEKVPDATPRKEESRYVRFWLAVNEAMTLAEGRYIQVLEDAAQGNAEVCETVVHLNGDGNPLRKTSKRSRMRPQWQAAAWWLQHWSPLKREGKNLRLTGIRDDSVVFSQHIDVSRLADEELAQLEALLEKCLPAKAASEDDDPGTEHED